MNILLVNRLLKSCFRYSWYVLMYAITMFLLLWWMIDESTGRVQMIDESIGFAQVIGEHTGLAQSIDEQTGLAQMIDESAMPLFLWRVYAILIILQDIFIRDHSSKSSIWFIVFRPGTIFPDA